MPLARRRARALALNAAAALVPLAALALAEGALRLAGVGDDYPLFVASRDDPRYLMPNPEVIGRYFPAGYAPALAIEPNYFLREKPTDGIRIFVQGGSSAAGFPIGASTSIAGLLGYRLRSSFPDRPVEVVDTALSAVMSHTLLDFADEIIAESPDAVLIYAGHNEFIGILGTGSVWSGSGSRALTRLALALDKLRLYQLARGLLFRARLPFRARSDDDGRTLMAAIAAAQEIALDSPEFRRGIDLWRENLAALIAKYTDAGIPVFVGTVASNLKDQPPFVSAAPPHEQAAALADTLAAIEAGRVEAIAPADLAALEAAAAEHASADLHFAAGRAHELLEDSAGAQRAYTLARDHDRLRFRAPSAINAVVRELAAGSPARLVDVEARFEGAAPDGLVGFELMLEHVHPTVEGYLLLADAFYQALADAAVPAPFPAYVDADAAHAEFWILPAERYYAAAAVADLKSDFPFTPTPRMPELPPVRNAADALGRAWFDEEISWLELAEASRELMADDPLGRAIASERIAAALPFRRDLAERAAADRRAAGRP